MNGSNHTCLSKGCLTRSSLALPTDSSFDEDSSSSMRTLFHTLLGILLRFTIINGAILSHLILFLCSEIQQFLLHHLCSGQPFGVVFLIVWGVLNFWPAWECQFGPSQSLPCHLLPGGFLQQLHWWQSRMGTFLRPLGPHLFFHLVPPRLFQIVCSQWFWGIHFLHCQPTLNLDNRMQWIYFRDIMELSTMTKDGEGIYNWETCTLAETLIYDKSWVQQEKNTKRVKGMIPRVHRIPPAKDIQRSSHLSWYDLPSPSPPTSGHLQPHLPPLHSNSEAYLCNLCNYVMPTLRLTTDQYQTHSDLVPMPRATVYIPFLHLSYLPDPFSLTIAGNYSFLV